MLKLSQIKFSPFFLLSLLSCLFILAGCQTPASKPNQKVSEIRLGLEASPLSLDPRVGGDVRSILVTRMLFEGLMHMEPNDKAALALADRVDISDNRLVYTFHLRPSVWSNGDPVTSHDFEYAWKGVIAKNSSSVFGYAFYPILNAEKAKKGLVSLDEVGICCPSDDLIQVTLEYDAPFFLELVANPLYAPVHRQVDMSQPKWTLYPDTFVGNGPFILKKWKLGEEIVVSKNPNYWDAKTVCLDQIKMSVVEDIHTTQLMFERGEIDFIGDPLSAIPVDTIKAWRGRFQTKEVAGHVRLYFNLDRFPFNNRSIRQAFSYAIHRQAIVDSLLDGVEPISTSLLPANLTLHDDLIYPDGDCVRARAAFEKGLGELGLTRETFPAITINLVAKDSHKALVQAVQQQWSEVLGVNINLDACDYGTWLQNFRTSQFDVATGVWYSYYNDPFYNLELYFRRHGGLNPSGWEDPRYVKLLTQSKYDSSHRLSYLKAAEALVAEEAPYTGLYSMVFRYQTRQGVENIYIEPTGRMDFKWTKVQP